MAEERSIMIAYRELISLSSVHIKYLNVEKHGKNEMFMSYLVDF